MDHLDRKVPQELLAFLGFPAIRVQRENPGSQDFQATQGFQVLKVKMDSPEDQAVPEAQACQEMQAALDCLARRERRDFLERMVFLARQDLGETLVRLAGELRVPPGTPASQV